MVKFRDYREKKIYLCRRNPKSLQMFERVRNE